jgi:hypothetical protein
MYSLEEAEKILVNTLALCLTEVTSKRLKQLLTIKKNIQELKNENMDTLGY